VFGGFARIMCESDAALFGVTVDNGRAYGEFGEDASIVDRAWTLLLERYELFMRYQGVGLLGHVVSDKTGGADMQHVHTLVSNSRRGRNPVSGIRTPRVISIEFVDSLDSLLVQAADVAAYIISRHLNGDARFGWMAARLLEKMWVSADGRQRGWKSLWG